MCFDHSRAPDRQSAWPVRPARSRGAFRFPFAAETVDSVQSIFGAPAFVRCTFGLGRQLHKHFRRDDCAKPDSGQDGLRRSAMKTGAAAFCAEQEGIPRTRQGVRSCAISRFFSSAHDFFALSPEHGAAKAPAGSTALCEDGSYSSAAKRSDAMRRASGVETWTEPPQRQCGPSLPQSWRLGLRR